MKMVLAGFFYSWIVWLVDIPDGITYSPISFDHIGQYAFMQRDELQVLEVQEAIPSNSGVIEVVARNPYGEVSCSANLAVQGKHNICGSLWIIKH